MYFKGETSCQALLKNGSPCQNTASYEDIPTGKYVCGVHSKANSRHDLPVNPDKNSLRDEAISCWMSGVAESASGRKNLGRLGKLSTYKMKMMKKVPLKEGVLNIFPNFKHQNRKDGIGCSELSPMSLGPVKHNQPGLPESLSIENFHQGSKVFFSELDEDGNPSEEFYSTQKEYFLDPVPHRHKKTSGNKNIPEYFVWKTADGQEHHLSYIESRQFYCNFYERLASQTESYQQLLDLLRNGFNLCICGYDAFTPTESSEFHYLDDSRPFGHEMVLYTMLKFDLYGFDKRDLPWRIYKNFDF